MHLNVNIESMDMFNCLYIVDYICYSRSNTILYSMLVLFAVVESKLLTQTGLEKAQRGSNSTVQNKVNRQAKKKFTPTGHYWENMPPDPTYK